MWIENKNDKYMFRESYIDPLTEKKKIVSVTMKSKSRASQKQAKIILSEKIEKNYLNLMVRILLQAKLLKNVFKNGYQNTNS